MDIDDAYTAYCFDEACNYIITRIEEGEEPIFKRRVKSFKELYEQYE